MRKFEPFWSDLRGTFWFVPSLIIAVSIVLAIALIEADATAGSMPWMAHWPRLFCTGAAGARGMLSTIAGSMMTVVGVTFSMILVALALASSQYTSRILRNFIGDRVTQAVLGIFAGIFTYCLIVLRTIRGGSDSEFIPSLAVSFAVVLAIGNISALIFFIHLGERSIEAPYDRARLKSRLTCVREALEPKQIAFGAQKDGFLPFEPPPPTSRST